MLKIDIQICFTTIPPMQNFIEIHQRNPELLSSGGFRPPPPRLDRGIERPRLDRVKFNNDRLFNMLICSFPFLKKTISFSSSKRSIFHVNELEKKNMFFNF